MANEKIDFKNFNKETFDYKNRSVELARYYPEYFHVWWYFEKFNWNTASYFLSSNCRMFFNIWWNEKTPDKFNWGDSDALAAWCYKHFNIWWNKMPPDAFNWERGSRSLSYRCRNHFKIWWNPNEFNWKDSSLLARFCYKHINVWWNHNKYDWKWGSEALARYCYKYFGIWGKDLSKFNYKDGSWALPLCGANNFHKWWLNPRRRFNWERGTWYLVRYCSKHFKIWYYNPSKLNWHCKSLRGKALLDALEKYCGKHKDRWEADFVIYGLLTEGKKK